MLKPLLTQCMNRAELLPMGDKVGDKVQVGNVVAMMSFAAVVSTGSFSAAAQQLNCSKAAVSRQIARLEISVGLKLLTRTTRSVSLTPAGRELYGRCARIVDEVNETNQIMSGMLTTPRGNLKVNAPVVSTVFRITEVIPRFIKRYPDVRVHLNLSDNKVDLLHGSFDAAFWVGEPYDSALESVKLREYDMVLAGAPEYSAAAASHRARRTSRNTIASWRPICRVPGNGAYPKTKRLRLAPGP